MFGLPLDPPLACAVAALTCAALQGILARWRDLGPLPVGLGALALLPGRGDVLPWLAAAAVLASLAWARAGRSGVGRPALTGVALSAGLIGRVIVQLRPGDLPPVSAAVAVIVAAATLVALERRGPRPRVVRWIGRVPVDDDPPRA